MKRIDLSGQQFNAWFVLQYVGKKGYKCRCKCGVEKLVQTGNLTTGTSRSCRQCSSFAVEIHNKLPEGEGAFNDLYSHYRQSAKVRNLDWAISKEEAKVLFLQTCAYCGCAPSSAWPINRTDMNGSFKYNGIDRLDSSTGYVLSNCVACCKTCNYMKRSLSVEQFKVHILRIAAHMEAM